MSEFVSSWHFSEREQAKEVEKVGEKALTIVDAKYGTGYPDYRGGRRELAYHNGHHAREVGQTAYRLCAILDMSPLERTAARSAGYAHDIVQLKGVGANEEESAEWIEQELARQEIVAPPLRKMTATAILGTEPTFHDGRLVGQKATELDYLTIEAERVAKSVASADLGELYTPEGPLLSHQLFREIHGMVSPQDLPMEKMVDFQRNQVRLLEEYRYPLPEAESELTTFKAQVISYSANLLHMIEAGTISSWDDIVRLDHEFIGR